MSKYTHSNAPDWNCKIIQMKCKRENPKKPQSVIVSKCSLFSPLFLKQKGINYWSLWHPRINASLSRMYLYRCGCVVRASQAPGSLGASAERGRAGERPAFRHCPHPAGCWTRSSLQHRPAGNGGKKWTRRTLLNKVCLKSLPYSSCNLCAVWSWESLHAG